jgi:hypothetical protein
MTVEDKSFFKITPSGIVGEQTHDERLFWRLPEDIRKTVLDINSDRRASDISRVRKVYTREFLQKNQPYAKYEHQLELVVSLFDELVQIRCRYPLDMQDQDKKRWVLDEMIFFNQHRSEVFVRAEVRALLGMAELLTRRKIELSGLE